MSAAFPGVPFDLLGVEIPDGEFCGGAFGRDFYGDGHIEAAGRDWVVFRSNAGAPWFAEGKQSIELIREAVARGRQ